MIKKCIPDFCLGGTSFWEPSQLLAIHSLKVILQTELQ